jgi:putative ABC transport system permease protein
LVVTEIALALVLLVSAGLLIHSFLELQRVKPGFRQRHVLTMAIPLPQARYATGERVARFYQLALANIAALPGVEAAAVSTSLPLRGWGFGMWYAVEGRPAPALPERPAAHFQMVGPRYFKALEIPLLKGRSFTEQDLAGAPPVAIINETMMRRNFSRENAIGKHLLVDALIAGRQELGPAISWEIVGVVGNVKVSGLGDEDTPEIYVPYPQSPWPGMFLAVHTATDPSPMLNAIKTAIHEVDKDVPVADPKTMEQIMAESVAEPRFRTQLLGAFALVALALASVGIYGVMSYSVSQRTTEIGIRLALGAQRQDVLKLVVRQGMVLALLGVAVGLAAAIAFTRVMGSLLFEITPTDPVTFIMVSVLLTIVALAACFIPALRASRVDPIVALRYE